MSSRMRQDLDNYITGHWGEDQFGPEPPEEMYHEACNGEGCVACNGTGLDPAKMELHRKQQEAEDRALAEAILNDHEAEENC